MCAIFGYQCRGEYRPSVEDIADLAAAGESRGKDASGLAWLSEDNHIGVVKAPIEAGVYLKKANLEELFSRKEFNGKLPKLLIGHTRAATQGSPWKDVNNHPIVDLESGTALVHNGIISNDDDVYKRIKPNRTGEVDSEAILGALLHAQGDIPNRIAFVGTTLKGSYACAVISASTPGALTLFRHSSPCVFWWNAAKEILWFASTEDMVDIVRAENPAGPLPWLPPPVEMPNNSWIIFEANGQVRDGVFKASDGPTIYRARNTPIHTPQKTDTYDRPVSTTFKDERLFTREELGETKREIPNNTSLVKVPNKGADGAIHLPWQQG